MSFYDVQPYDEGTPLLADTGPNRFKYNVPNPHGSSPETVGNICVDHKNQSTTHVNSNNQSLASNDGNNNSNDLGEDPSGVDLQQPEIRVYAKRWYILAVFSLLGVLQVSCNFHCKCQ